MTPADLPAYTDLKAACDWVNVKLVLPESLTQRTIALVGESLGTEEDISGLYFHGKAGKLLDRLLAGAGLLRSILHITNVIKVQPPGNKVERLPELGVGPDGFLPALTDRSFIPYLREELTAVKPTFIIAVGALAMETLTGQTQILRRRGSIVTSLPEFGSVPVGITLHPSYLQRGQMHLFPYVRHDLKMFGELAFDARPTMAPYERLIDPSMTDIVDFLHNIHQNSTHMAFDIETVNKKYITCFGLSASPNNAMCIPIRYKGFRNRWSKAELVYILGLVREVYHKPGLVKIGQTMRYDMHYLLPLLGLPREPWFDTYVAHCLIHPDARHDLGFIMSVYTDMPYHKDDFKDWAVKEVPHDVTLWQYNVDDCIGTHRSAVGLEHDLCVRNMWDFFAGYQMPFQRVLFEMEHAGLSVNHKLRNEWTRRVEDEDLPDAQWQIDELAGIHIDPNSSKQVGEYLENYLHIKVPRTDKGNYTVKEDKLDAIVARYPQHKRILEKIICTRKLKAKVLGTYLRAPLSPDGRLRTSYGTTVTGRLTSRQDVFGDGTNLQNQPKQFRRLYIPEPGDVFLEPDLSQAEARVMAWLMQSKILVGIFDAGQKVHTFMGAAIFDVASNALSPEQYKIAKQTVHGTNYCMGIHKYAALIGKPVAEAKIIRERYLSIVPELPEYWHWVQETMQHDRMLTTPYGRQRIFTGRLDDEDFRSGYAQIPQSAVVDTMNIGLLGLFVVRPKTVKFKTQTHDSALFSLPLYHVPMWNALTKMHLETLRTFEIRGEPLTIPIDLGEVKYNWLGR